MPNINDDMAIYGSLFVRGTTVGVDAIRTQSRQGFQVGDQQTTQLFPALLAVNDDPVIAARVATIGSLYMRTSTPGELWLKIGAAAIDWQMVAGASAALTGATLTINGAISPAAIGPGAVNNYNPAGLSNASILRQAVDVAGATLTGIALQPTGRVLFVENLGPGALTIAHESGSSTAGNRFNNPNDVDWTIPVDGNALFVYDNSLRWRMIAAGTNVFPFVEVSPAAGSPATNAARLLTWGGNPNGALTAPDGSICMDSVTPGVWMNLDGATRWVLVGSQPNAADGFYFRDDLLGNLDSNFTVAGTGTNTIGGNFVPAGRPGVCRQAVVTTATPDRAVMTYGPNCILLGGGPLTVSAAVRPVVLQDATDRWSYRVGLGDVTTAANPTDGVFFENDLAVDGSNNWFGVTIAGGARTAVDLGVAPTANVFDTLRFVVNAAGTLVTWFVNNVQVGTSNANIPTGGTQQTGTEFVQLIKTLGNVNGRNVDIDFFEAFQYLTTRR